jgi:hypothetical protein
MQDSELNDYTSKLIEKVLYLSKSPKDHQNILNKLYCILKIANSSILTKIQDHKLSLELKEIKDNFHVTSLDNLLQNLIHTIISTNPKFKIIKTINDIEDYICDKNPNISKDELDKNFEHLLEHLQNDLKESEIFGIERELEEIRKRLLLIHKTSDENTIITTLKEIAKDL